MQLCVSKVFPENWLFSNSQQSHAVSKQVVNTEQQQQSQMFPHSSG